MRDGIVYCRLHYDMLQHTTGLPGGLSNANGPCDLSGGSGGNIGPHHGLLPPSGFHGLSESMSPSYMINIMSADPDSGFHPLSNRSPMAGGNGSNPAGGGANDYNPASLPDFQRCLNTPSFFPSVGGGGGGGAMAHVQKGRPRKRKIPALHSNANHSDPASLTSSLRQLGSGMGELHPRTSICRPEFRNSGFAHQSCPFQIPPL